jgi:hypothetical protein
VIIGVRIRLSKPDGRGQEDLPEMAQQLRIAVGKIGAVQCVGIRERVYRKVFRGAGEESIDAGHFADKDRVPALDELRVGEFDAKRRA